MTSRVNSSLLLAGALAVGQSAAGGITSAGDVEFKPVLTCNATSIDPTHPSMVAKIALVKETDWDGSIRWGDKHLTLVTYDRNDQVIRYVPAQEIDVRQGFPTKIDLYRYRPGSAGNEILGSFEFKQGSMQQKAYVRSYKPAELEELILNDCRS